VAPEAIVSGRVVVVLGYSDGTEGSLHPVCGARLAQAASIAEETDTVVLSGWARHPHGASEAELMAHAWTGPPVQLILDPDARSTLGNAVNASATARALRAKDVVVVTSSWHGRRAAALFRAALRGTGARVTVSPSSGPPHARARLREAACWALVPLQAGMAARRP
jgi:uncharacterized SAM-binding protein YcdF (DUF218 family)